MITTTGTNEAPRANVDPTTISGVPVRECYTHRDVADLAPSLDNNVPGEFPFTRGIHADMYRGKSSGHSISVDGSFGRETVEAVKKFQNKEGLTADGIVGAITWSALNGH